jgi:hypothetical protein
MTAIAKRILAVKRTIILLEIKQHTMFDMQSTGAG